MSSEVDQARLMAERIAKRVLSQQRPARESVASDIGSELAAMRASLSDLQNRLIQIESKVRAGNTKYSSSVATPQMHSPWLVGVNASHPSEERFGVEEATISDLVDYFQNEKLCGMEPGGKPCDHCAMCSSRGF
jgi:hypothetical protein